MPELQAVVNEHPACALVTVLVSGSRDMANATARGRGVTAPILLDPGGAIRDHFHIRSTPTTLVLDAEGRWVDQLVGVHPRDRLARACRGG